MEKDKFQVGDYIKFFGIHYEIVFIGNSSYVVKAVTWLSKYTTRIQTPLLKGEVDMYAEKINKKALEILFKDISLDK